MVVPTRSQNSSWHSLWDLQGTQAPQLRQSNNTLGGGGGGRNEVITDEWLVNVSENLNEPPNPALSHRKQFLLDHYIVNQRLSLSEKLIPHQA